MNIKLSKNDKYWIERKIDWKSHYFNLKHPHRKMLIEVLRQHLFEKVLEIGCGAGANLHLISKEFGAGVSGCDINEDAIEFAKEKIPEGDLKVGNATELPFHGGKFDIVLTDACLIYIEPARIKRVLREIRRVGSRRGAVIFIEFHSKNPLKRLALRMTSRYYAYDYHKLLAGQFFKGIQTFKIGEEQWPGQPWSGKESYGYLIKAVI